MTRIYSEEHQTIIDNLQKIMYNYDEKFIKIARTFVPENEIQLGLLSDPTRLEMLRGLLDVIIHSPFIYETKLN